MLHQHAGGAGAASAVAAVVVVVVVVVDDDVNAVGVVTFMTIVISPSCPSHDSPATCH